MLVQYANVLHWLVHTVGGKVERQPGVVTDANTMGEGGIRAAFRPTHFHTSEFRLPCWS